MATVVATITYFAIFLFSFLAARKVVTNRGLQGALGLAICCLALIALFAYAPSVAPFAPLDQSLPFAFAQMVLIGTALGIPAGFLHRWKHGVKAPKNE